MFTTPTLLLTLSFIQTIFAVPISLGDPFGGSDAPTSTETPTALSQDTVNAEFLRPAQFSRIAYCSSAAVSSWQCGAPCSDLGNDIEVLQAGGVFIAHDPSTQSIVVAHEGTDPTNLLSVLNDVEIPLVSLNSSRFPNVDGDWHPVFNVKHRQPVHDGFQQTFERTADGILAGVQAGLASKGVSKVLVTGHSQGAAIAMMDAVMLHQELGPSVEITTTVFGLPRGGNPAWANFVDSTIGSTTTHMTNQDDIVPRLPPRLLDYQQPSGEVHIRAVDANGNPTDVVACPGQENENCSEGISDFDISIPNHLGTPLRRERVFRAFSLPALSFDILLDLYYLDVL
ncbi:hypothetical protein C0995_000646 [Termitomyces sp. Mi166|nr:hypothetical protein C0995_000646 [Termitomyces sp. Mi166\